jgi:predicted MPP superfamily phosphohydrolase
LNLHGHAYLVAIVLGILSLSVVSSIFLGRKTYTFLSRKFYVASMSWLGFFGYFLFASLVYLPVATYAAYVGTSYAAFGLALFIASVIVGIYGLVHARIVIVKYVSVTLPHLPESWRGRKAVWISDTHVGQIYGKESIEKIVGTIQRIVPDIVFIGGDLFDGAVTPEILGLIAPLRKLSPPLGVYFISGNHEEYGNKERFIQSVEDVGIRVLRDEKILIDGLQLIGVDYAKTSQEVNFKSILETLDIDKNMPSILLKHEPKHLEIAAEAAVSLQISGHTHRGQQWPFEYFARLSYGQFTYGLHSLKNMLVYTSSGAGTWGPPLRVGTNREIVVFSFT